MEHSVHVYILHNKYKQKMQINIQFVNGVFSNFEVYRTRFLDVVDFVNGSLITSLQRFAPNGLILWNIFIPKPDVPPAIAANYRQVI